MYKPWLMRLALCSLKYFYMISFYSLGETCSHVGALLFKVEALVRLEQTRETPTDVACQWNKISTKTVPFQPVSGIEFYCDAVKKKLSAATPKAIPSPPTAEDVDEFLTAMNELPEKVSEIFGMI